MYPSILLKNSNNLKNSFDVYLTGSVFLDVPFILPLSLTQRNVMKAYVGGGGCGCKALWFLTLALDESGQFHVPVAFPEAQRPQYPLNRRLSGLHSRYGRLGERTNVPHLGNRYWIPKTCYFRIYEYIQREAMASIFRLYAYDTDSN
jgi:hypothetical protein